MSSNKLFKESNETTVNDLVRQYSQRTYGVCYSFVRNKEDAEDIVQEVFAEVSSSLHKFLGKSSVSTWIYRITISKSIDFLRKKKRKKRFGEVRKIFEVGKVANLIPDPGKTPEQTLITEEWNKALHIALDELGESQRVALVMKFFQDFSQKEIAEVMNLSESAVEGLMQRGKKNLEKKLVKYYNRTIS
jgi:RNA polymerase sigma-70 factor, ECF subfamily